MIRGWARDISGEDRKMTGDQMKQKHFVNKGWPQLMNQLSASSENERTTFINLENHVSL